MWRNMLLDRHLYEITNRTHFARHSQRVELKRFRDVVEYCRGGTNRPALAAGRFAPPRAEVPQITPTGQESKP